MQQGLFQALQLKGYELLRTASVSGGVVCPITTCENAKSRGYGREVKERVHKLSPRRFSLT